jgi:N-acetylneuraminic acid mutarotase
MTNLQKFQLTVLFLFVLSAFTSSGQTFTNLPNFPGSERFAATSFSIGNVVYYATGAEVSTSTDKNDLWSYDVSTGIWEQKSAIVGAPGRMLAASFALNGKGYVGTGKINSGGSFITVASFANDFYKYDPTTNTWTQINSVGPIGRLGAVGFAVNGKGYIALGSSSGGVWSNIGTSTKTIFELDPATDTWTERPYPSNYQGFVSASAFVLNGKAYIAGGFTPGFEVGSQAQAAFSLGTYEFDPVTLNWTVKAFMPQSRYIAATFSALDRGYIVGGNLPNSTGGFGIAWTVGPFSNQVLKYNPISNQWTTLSTTAPQFLSSNSASSVCENGFISTGAFRHPTNENRIANLQFSPEVDPDYIQTSSGSVCSTFDSQFTLQLSAAGTVNWTTSPNIYITSGQGTKTINVRSNSNGNAWVQASINLGCRVVTFPQKTTWAGNPPANNSTLIWTGVRGVNPVTLNAGSINYYQVDNVPYATSYTWSLPRGFTAYGSSTTTSGPQIQIITGNQAGTFSLLCRANNACGSSWTNSLTINVVGGGGGGGIQMRAAFPNPANDSFTVKVKEADSKEVAEIALFNKSMERVYFTKTEEKEVTVSTTNLLPGLYYLNVVIGKEVTQKQVVVNH